MPLVQVMKNVKNEEGTRGRGDIGGARNLKGAGSAKGTEGAESEGDVEVAAYVVDAGGAGSAG